MLSSLAFKICTGSIIHIVNVLHCIALGEAKKYPTSVVVVGGTQWLPT